MLKRKKPLKAKQGFKVKRKRLNPYSKSKVKEREQYRAARLFYLNKHPNCEICQRPADDIHHKRGRGKFLCDTSTFMATCRFCHNRIHDNPGWARENGYLIYQYGEGKGNAGGADRQEGDD